MKARALLSLLLVALLSGAALAGGTGWHTSWDEAAKESKKTKKPILMDFTGSDWCGWCIRLKKEVFDTETFKTWANDHVVLLELDFPRTTPQAAELKEQNKELLAKYGVRGFPTIIFADHEGKLLGRYGYDEGGPENWTKKAEAKISGK